MLRAFRNLLLVPILAGSLASVVACDAPKKPLREWRAEDHLQPAEADPSRMPGAQDDGAPSEPEAGGVERAAEALWNVSCASCHGRDGRGTGMDRPPGAQLPDFTAADFQKSRTDAQLAEVITNGRNMMPPFGKQVNAQGIEALIAHIRRFDHSPSPAP